MEKKWKEVQKACMKAIKSASSRNQAVEDIDKGFKKQEKTKQHSKSEKRNSDALLNSFNKSNPSVMFLNKVYETTITQNENFYIQLPILNVGKIPVKRIKILCSTMDGVSLDKPYYEIGALSPGEQCNINLSGKVSKEIGLYYIVCRIYKELKELCCPLICTIKVVTRNSLECDKQKIDHTKTGITSDVILKCQKEIRENMNEIQERLESINTLRSRSIEKIFPTTFPCDKEEKMFVGTGNETNKKQDFITKDGEFEKFIINSDNKGDDSEEKFFDIKGKTTVKTPTDNYFDNDNNIESKL